MIYNIILKNLRISQPDKNRNEFLYFKAFQEK